MTDTAPCSPARHVPRTATSTPVRKARAFLPIAVDLVVPTALYFLLARLGLSQVWALTLAGAATGASAAVATVRRRRLDGVGVLVVVEITATVVLLLVSDDPRVALLKPSFYTAVAAVYLFLSCVVGRPVVYEVATPVATDGDPARLAAYHRAWEISAPFRRGERLVTGVFATALLLDAVLRAVVVLHVPPDQVGAAVLLGQAPGLVLVVLALVVTKLQVPGLSRIVDDVQADLVRTR